MIKKITYLLIGFVFFQFACKEEKKTDSSKTEPQTDLSTNPLYQQGVELIAKSDCLTCHKLKEKNIGPSYQDIANKYSNDDKTIKHLSEKIIKGSKGEWGEIPMTPHPTLSQEDAATMVKYIFLLKSK